MIEDHLDRYVLQYTHINQYIVVYDCLYEHIAHLVGMSTGSMQGVTVAHELHQPKQLMETASQEHELHKSNSRTLNTGHIQLHNTALVVIINYQF